MPSWPFLWDVPVAMTTVAAPAAPQQNCTETEVIEEWVPVTRPAKRYIPRRVVPDKRVRIVPDKRGVQPRYQQVNFDSAEKRGRLRLIISPDSTQGSLNVYQDVRVYAGLFNGEESFDLALAENRYAYVHVARGALEVNGVRLVAGDGARVRRETALNFSKGENAEVLVWDLRPNELPGY